jgi:hypothetical protein
MNNDNDFDTSRYYMSHQTGLLRCAMFSRIDTVFLFCHHEVTHVHI